MWAASGIHDRGKPWTGIKKRNNRAKDGSGSLVHYNIMSAALCNAVKDARVRPLLLLG